LIDSEGSGFAGGLSIYKGPSGDGGHKYAAQFDVRKLLPLTGVHKLRVYLAGHGPLAEITIKAADLGVAGYIDGATSSGIKGWVNSFKLREPLKVAIRVDGKFVADLTADEPRPDLLVWGFANGACGFNLQASLLRDVRPGSEVSVLLDDKTHLSNSPLRFEP
jgi:hypothetical protein